MLMMSSSQPWAIDGRVEPSREVSSTAATPAAAPTATNSQKRTALTFTPDQRAATSLAPVA